MRNFSVIECEQRSPEWVSARVGRVTGTTADAVLAKGKGGAESVQRAKLRIRLALERQIGKSLESDFQSAAMTQGIEREGSALFEYEKQRTPVYRAGFVAHNDLLAGCSVDGFTGDFDGLVSIKCPEWPAHWDTLKGKTIKLDYMRQIIHEQWITGAAWTDFVSYNPDFEGRLKLVIVRVPRNEDSIQQHSAEIGRFLIECDVEYLALKKMAEGIAVPA